MKISNVPIEKLLDIPLEEVRWAVEESKKRMAGYNRFDF